MQDLLDPPQGPSFPDLSDYLTTRDLANMLGCSWHWARYLIEQGDVMVIETRLGVLIEPKSAQTLKEKRDQNPPQPGRPKRGQGPRHGLTFSYPGGTS